MSYKFKEMNVTGVCARANIFKRQSMPTVDANRRAYSLDLVVDVDSDVDLLLSHGIHAKLDKKHKDSRVIRKSGVHYRLGNKLPFPVFTLTGENIRNRSEGLSALDSFLNGCTVSATIKPFVTNNNFIYRRVFLLVKSLEILSTPDIPEQWSII